MPTNDFELTMPDLYVDKQLCHQTLLSEIEDSPHGMCGMDDQPYESAKEEKDDLIRSITNERRDRP